MTQGERGSISMVAAALSLILALTAAAGADLGSLLIARARARTAADAAALAAASALVPLLAEGADPQMRARNAASANGAQLKRCVCEPGSIGAIVDVEVVGRAMFVRAWDGMIVRASARAEVDPDVYSYRG